VIQLSLNLLKVKITEEGEVNLGGNLEHLNLTLAIIDGESLERLSEVVHECLVELSSL
jgi:hypothetical protein